MAYQLKALVNGAVVLAVDVFSGTIGNTQDDFSIALIFTCLVNFQLNTKVASVCTIENRLRLVIIIVDEFVPAFFVAIIAIVITVLIIGIFLFNNRAAVRTASVIFVIALLTDRPIVADRKSVV